MAPNNPVTDTHRLTYADNVQLAVQSRTAPFDNAFMYQEDLKGEDARVVDLIGKTNARRNAPRGGDTPNIDAKHEPVWCIPERIDWGKVIEKEDQIKALTDYHSPYVQNGALAVRKERSLIQGEKFFADRRIGKKGGETNKPWAGKSVPKTIGSSDGATDVGMNVKKLLRGRRYLMAAHVDFEMEQIFVLLDAEQNESLYYDVTFVSTEYRKSAVLEEKVVRSILGMTIIDWEYSAPVDATTARNVMWAKSGMVWGEFSSLDIQSAPNPAKQYREHPYMEQWVGATRTEDEKVVAILNEKE